MNAFLKLACLLPIVATLTTPALAELPDLAVTQVGLNDQCRVVYTLTNLGPGTMPESAFVAGSKPLVATDIDGSQRAFGQYSDPNKALQQPGGTLGNNPLTSPMVLGQHTVRVRIDPTNMLSEADESNNQMTVTVTGNCPQLQPDLALTGLRFLSDCRAELTLTNTGGVDLPSDAYNVSGIAIRRTIDGVDKGYISLRDLDPGRALRPPGGTVTWQEFPEFIPQTGVSYRIDLMANETDPGNNSQSLQTAGNCGSQGDSKASPARPTRALPAAPAKTAPLKLPTYPYPVKKR